MGIFLHVSLIITHKMGMRIKMVTMIPILFFPHFGFAHLVLVPWVPHSANLRSDCM
jgi:hypothetical protein